MSIRKQGKEQNRPRQRRNQNQSVNRHGDIDHGDHRKNLVDDPVATENPIQTAGNIGEEKVGKGPGQPTGDETKSRSTFKLAGIDVHLPSPTKSRHQKTESTEQTQMQENVVVKAVFGTRSHIS